MLRRDLYIVIKRVRFQVGKVFLSIGRLYKGEPDSDRLVQKSVGS